MIMEERKLEKTASQPDFQTSRICSVGVLERKHSSGDLQSRLKTRKILGVGETDNGDVHRSKISQVLGHNEHLFVKFPRLYWGWHFLVASVFTLEGLYKSFPLFNACDVSEEVDRFFQSEKCCGSILLGFSLILWMLLGTTDKSLARALMTAAIVSQTAQLLSFCHYLFRDKWYEDKNLNAYLSLFLVCGCSYFIWAIGSSRAGLRRSLSNKDLRERQPTPEDQHNPPSPRQQQDVQANKKNE